VLEFFRREGKGYQTRMNAVLRAYIRPRMAGGRSHVFCVCSSGDITPPATSAAQISSAVSANEKRRVVGLRHAVAHEGFEVDHLGQ